MSRLFGLIELDLLGLLHVLCSATDRQAGCKQFAAEGISSRRRACAQRAKVGRGPVTELLFLPRLTAGCPPGGPARPAADRATGATAGIRAGLRCALTGGAGARLGRCLGCGAPRAPDRRLAARSGAGVD